jgi:iron complex transport system ATP-binding protein
VAVTVRAAVKAAGIRVSDLSLEIGGVPILSGISFSAEPGSAVFIVGKNGAGKSTLLRCVAGMIKNYTGGIYIGGTSAAPMSSRDRARLVAYVPQWSPADVPYTVFEFMEMSRYPWKPVSTDADDRRAAAEAGRLAGIEGLSGRRISSLSGGERQKVMIAAAIAQETGVILMDEPTTYLDYAHQVEAMDIITGVNRERGVTMIVVTHDVNLALSAAGHVIALSGGHVLCEGAPKDICTPGCLESIYGTGFRRYIPDSREGHEVLLPIGSERHGARLA